MDVGRNITLDDLAQALDAGEFEYFYQPKICMRQGTVVGAEALMRWRGADGSITPPGLFIPLAEQSGFITDLTAAMIPKGLSDLRDIHDGGQHTVISYNVSGPDLCSPYVVNEVKGFLAEGSVDAACVQLEVTESATVDNIDQIADRLDDLAKLGIELLMDDFGTGYSSVDLLGQLPFSTLKLDQGVVMRMGASARNLNIVKSAISMARELRMRTVAEGIETEADFNFLVAHGCESAQGFWMAKPMALDDFLSFISAGHRWTGSQLGMVHQAKLNTLYYRKCLIDAAFCVRLNPDNVLKSVLEPDVSHISEGSRFGKWYYAAQDALNQFEAFRDLEAPHRLLHETGGRMMDVIAADPTKCDINAFVSEISKASSEVERLLDLLEQEILFETERACPSPVDA